MDPHLKNLRQLAVDRRRRPRDGRLEHLAHLIERNRQRAASSWVSYSERRAGSCAANRRTLDHLLGRGQKRHELQGECGVGAPRLMASWAPPSAAAG